MSVESNIAARKAADAFRELAEEIVESVPDDAKVRFWRLVFKELKERFPEEKVAPPVPPERVFDSDEEDAIAIAEEIIELSESEELPERAIEFAESVAGRARDILATIEERGEATTNQLTALENMRTGLQKWFR
jgi:hypothetical protein